MNGQVYPFSLFTVVIAPMNNKCQLIGMLNAAEKLRKMMLKLIEIKRFVEMGMKGGFLYMMYTLFLPHADVPLALKQINFYSVCKKDYL